VWYYDLRTDVEGIKKSNPLSNEHFDEFLGNYSFEKRADCERFFKVDIETIVDNDYDLNYKSYKPRDPGEEYPEPEEVLARLRAMTASLELELNALEDLVGGDA
jgi:type I restriction enzyme M protein